MTTLLDFVNITIVDIGLQLDYPCLAQYVPPGKTDKGRLHSTRGTTGKLTKVVYIRPEAQRKN